MGCSIIQIIDNREDRLERIVKEVKEWRAKNGKPGFKQE
jgi:hypothetical protein